MKQFDGMLAVLVLSFACILDMHAAVTTADGGRSGNDPGVHSARVSEQLNSCISFLRRERLIPANDPELVHALIKAILNEADCGAVLAADGDSDVRTPQGPAVKSSVLLQDRFILVRLNHAGTSLTTELAEQFDRVETDAAVGIIIDFRGVDSGTPLKAGALGKLADPAVPIVLLIDRNTSGVAENTVVALHDSLDAVTLGEPTRGMPFPRKIVRHKALGTFIIPDVPAGMNGSWEAEPVAPDIVIQSEEHTAQEPGEGREAPPDPWLQRAVDLMTTIHAFNTRHF